MWVEVAMNLTARVINSIEALESHGIGNVGHTSAG